MTDMLKVQEALQFTPTDLPYNRRGERSPAQIKAWNDAEKGCARNFLYIFLAIVVLTVVGSFLLQGPDRVGIFVPGGIMAAITLGGFFLMRSPTEGIDKVHSITGPARLSVDRGDKGSRAYMMMIDKYDFNVGPDLYDLLEHETVYTAHYLKLVNSHRLISLEEV